MIKPAQILAALSQNPALEVIAREVEATTIKIINETK
jgi:hypothetical protein